MSRDVFTLFFRSGPHTIPVDLVQELGGVETPVDLTGATVEVFIGSKPSVDPNQQGLLTLPATIIDDPTEGKIQFIISLADTETIGIGKRYLQVVYTSSGVITASPVAEFQILPKVQNAT